MLFIVEIVVEVVLKVVLVVGLVLVKLGNGSLEFVGNLCAALCVATSKRNYATTCEAIWLARATQFGKASSAF